MAMQNIGYKNQKKYQPAPDPLEIERGLPDMVPLPGWAMRKKEEALAEAREQDLRAAKSDAEKQAIFNAYAIKQAQIKDELCDKTVNKAFVQEFNNWVLGKSKLNDKNLTPWGYQRLTGKEINAYLHSFVDKKVEYQRKLARLKLFPPQTIGEAWLYFKYIVCKKEPLDEDYLSDFNYWTNPYFYQSQPGSPGHAPDDRDPISGQPYVAKASDEVPIVEPKNALTAGDPGTAAGTKAGMLVHADECEPLDQTAKEESSLNPDKPDTNAVATAVTQDTTAQTVTNSETYQVPEPVPGESELVKEAGLPVPMEQSIEDLLPSGSVAPSEPSPEIRGLQENLGRLAEHTAALTEAVGKIAQQQQSSVINNNSSLNVHNQVTNTQIFNSLVQQSLTQTEIKVANLFSPTYVTEQDLRHAQDRGVNLPGLPNESRVEKELGPGLIENIRPELKRKREERLLMLTGPEALSDQTKAIVSKIPEVENAIAGRGNLKTLGRAGKMRKFSVVREITEEAEGELGAASHLLYKINPGFSKALSEILSKFRNGHARNQDLVRADDIIRAAAVINNPGGANYSKKDVRNALALNVKLNYGNLSVRKQEELRREQKSALKSKHALGEEAREARRLKAIGSSRKGKEEMVEQARGGTEVERDARVKELLETGSMEDLAERASDLAGYLMDRSFEDSVAYGEEAARQRMMDDLSYVLDEMLGSIGAINAREMGKEESYGRGTESEYSWTAASEMARLWGPEGPLGQLIPSDLALGKLASEVHEEIAKKLVRQGVGTSETRKQMTQDIFDFLEKMHKNPPRKKPEK